MENMKKEISVRKGQTYYLLGKDKDGIKYWMPAASWDCDWYWGFGYVQSFTNNFRPNCAHDTTSHQHFSVFFGGPADCYKEFNDFFVEHPFTQSEVWTLLELMKSFYTLREYADMLYNGGAHMAKNPCKNTIKNDEERNRINKIVLPAVFEQVYSILSVPDEKSVRLQTAMPFANKALKAGKTLGEINDEFNLWERIPKKTASRNIKDVLYRSYEASKNKNYHIEKIIRKKDEAIVIVGNTEESLEVSLYDCVFDTTRKETK